MKKVITLITIIFTVATVRAQFVSIPDTSFGNWLNANGFSSCMTGNGTTGWHLDTTCTAVVNATSMTIENEFRLQYLQGIQYFKNLTTLNLNGLFFLSSLPALPPALITFNSYGCSSLTTLPALPATLQTLITTANGLSSLPALPASLIYLSCGQNNITSLPALPANLVYLDCNNNSRIANLPALPVTLTYLNCSGNNIGSLPTLPTVLDTLICSYNALANLPALPDSLTYFDCSQNHNLSSMPVLPAGLIYFSCGQAPVGHIPTLPASLTYFACYVTNISSLPALPATLTYLDCSSNSLTIIPTLPDSLSWFDCSYNPNLTCLPHLNAVVHFNFTNTGVTCIPDLPTSNMYTNPTVPVCTGACTAGVNQLTNWRFIVFPNPASNQLTVENGETINQLRLTNILGQTVYSISGNNQLLMSIDVSQLQAGIYIIEAHSTSGINTAKVIVGN